MARGGDDWRMMSTLDVVVNRNRLPTGAQLRRISKSVEQFYYALLFSSSPSYADRAEPWLSWLRMGFNIATREAPSEASDADKLRVTVRPDGLAMEIQASSSNTEVLQRLHQLLQHLDALRGPVLGKDEDAKSWELMVDETIAGQLVKPVMSCLNRTGLRQDEADGFLAMLQRGLLALTHDDITSTQLSLH